MAKKKAASATKEVTYILTLLNGNLRKVTVPAAWRVTFGPLTMPKEGKKFSQFDNVTRTLCLRFYEGTTQRAVFTDVRSFRDSSISIQDRVTRTKAQVMQKHTPTGAKNVEVEARISEWVDPDEPEEVAAKDREFLQLESNFADE